MNIIAKKEKKFKLKGTKSQIKSILKTLMALNSDKTSPKIKYILISQVKVLIVKTLKMYIRLLKIYWAIDIKNKNYKQSSGVEAYSANDIYNMVTNLLENDGYKKVCKRTIERDIKLLNEMKLLQSKIRRLGKQKGSISHYRQNMTLAHIHKEIILEYLINLLKESLSDKKIIGNFDDTIVAEIETLNYTNLEKIETPSKLSEHNKITVMSHVEKSHVFNKANISNINKENSKNSLEKNSAKSLSCEKPKSAEQKSEKVRFKRIGVKTRLIDVHKISKNYMQQVKELSNNDSTYINALLNLETAINEYGKEYDIEDILKHFLKQFGNRYKYKVWMMMKRTDGVINDYELIWEGRFKDWYSHKYKKNYTTTKEKYGERIRLASKNFEFNASKNVKDEEEEKKEKEKAEKDANCNSNDNKNI
ncbi:plasmid maintenance protein [Borrelia crocidurae]|nr:plasmid maintenance protein [Borrelia crocidurae]